MCDHQMIELIFFARTIDETDPDWEEALEWLRYGKVDGC